MAAVALAREPFDPGLLAALRERLGERVTTAAAVCAHRTPVAPFCRKS